MAGCDDLELSERIVDEAIRSLLVSFDVQRMMENVGDLLRQSLGPHRLSLHLVVDDPPGVRLLLVDGEEEGAWAPGKILERTGSGHERAITTQRAVLVRPSELLASPCPEERRLVSLGYTCLSYFPLIIAGRVLATLGVACRCCEGQTPACFRVGERLAPLLAVALQRSPLYQEVHRLSDLLDRGDADEGGAVIERVGDYVLESASMREVMEHVRRVARAESTVLLLGETGTGKEGLARMVHRMSPRAGGSYVVLNIAAIPETLMESELFGHEKGSFTGATRQRIGLFEKARGGTLFLDEVGDIPLAVQVKLLRALQEREIQRIGGSGVISVDVRIVAATNRSLERMVERGEFRSDLYYRINIYPIRVPPLRERVESIRPLAAHFVELLSARMGRKRPQMSEEVLRALEAYDWPGNVRELEHFIERALVFSLDGSLKLPEPPGALEAPRPRGETTEGRPAPLDRLDRFDNLVRDLLRRTLEATGGKIYGPGGAAEVLGLKPTTLQGKLRKYGLKSIRPSRQWE